MTDSMNAETSGVRPRQPVRPLTQATAEGPSISQDNPLAENTFKAEPVGGTMPQPGRRPQRESAGSAAPSSPMPGRGPRFGELGRRAKDFFLGTKKRAAITVTGAVVMGGAALAAADQAGAFDSDTSTPVTAGPTLPGFEPNASPPPGATVEATKVPEIKRVLDLEIAHRNDYDGFSLLVPVDLTKPSVSDPTLTKNGKEISLPGVAEMYLDESFSDPGGKTVEQKVQDTLYKLLYQGYKNSNPETSVTLEQFTADAEEGKKKGTPPKYKITRTGTAPLESVDNGQVELNEQTHFEFMMLPKNEKNYAQPFQGYAFAMEEQGDNVVRLGIWSYANGSLAPEFQAPEINFYRSKYESTNMVTTAMKLLVVSSDLYTKTNLSNSQATQLSEYNYLYGDVIYRDATTTAPDGAIKSKPVTP